LSRQAKPQGRSAGATTASPPPGLTDEPAVPSRLVVRLIALAGLGWLGALAVMAWFTANPKALSRDQIIHADAVVIGRRVDPRRDRVKIERVLSGNLAADTEIDVLNLNDVSDLSSERSYLLPLTFFRQDYRVTTLEKQQVPPIVYPAEPEYIDRVKQALRDAK